MLTLGKLALNRKFGTHSQCCAAVLVTGERAGGPSRHGYVIITRYATL
jgi:hypothetical protein